MATTSGESAASLAERLMAEGFSFDFFQAVRLLEKLAPDRQPLGQDAPPATEIVRFRAHNSLVFPASEIFQIEPATARMSMPIMTVNFMGLTGPSGVLPRHYTEKLMQANEAKGPERYVARDWFDLFNHRFISLFYRAWTKYRFWISYERGEYAEIEPDVFTESLYCLIGMGGRSFRNRLHVVARADAADRKRERILAQVDDLALTFFAGLFAHRPRCAVSLERLLEDFFGISVTVLEFQGQWLQLEAENQSQVGRENATLGANVVVGARVWDVRSKIRIRLGPLSYKQFASFLPDQSPTADRKVFFKLMHLVRLYVGPEFKVDVQLILQASEIPPCRSGRKGARLGWDSWVTSRPMSRDSDDAVFPGVNVSWVREGERT